MTRKSYEDIQYTNHIREWYEVCTEKYGHKHPTTEFARILWLKEQSRYEPKCCLFKFFKKQKK